MVQRVRIIRLAAEGMRSEDVAQEVGVSCPTVHLWRQRFLALRLPRLEKDAPHSNSSSWLNMVERWFREITDKRLRRGAFVSERALINAITSYIDNHNQNPKAFVWTASTESFMRKIRINKEALESLH